ncbi:MAG: ComEC/Rec2 family competence protein [Dysgonamonadaceae bacterium]
MHGKFLQSAPFFRILIYLLTGILLQSNGGFFDFLPAFLAVGMMLMGLSFFRSFASSYRLHLFFSLGLWLFIAGLGILVTHIHQMQSRFDFPNAEKAYMGSILEIPSQKNKSIACRVTLDDYQNRKVMIYLEPNLKSRSLNAGDRIMMYTQLRRFKNKGNPDDFDYEKYMYQHGYAATAYVTSSRWKKLEAANTGLYAHSQIIRTKILAFYRSLGLEQDSFAVFAALTIGYKDELDESVQQAFRSTGTSHILCVSGLHVGIIYLVILSLLFFLPETPRMQLFKQLIIILFLWAYAFLTGLAPSVVRAVIMLSVFCVATALKRKIFSYNTVFFTAFVMLLIHPMDVYDVGFQLSFGAVLSIVYFLPVVLKWLHVKNRLLKWAWELAAVSLAVQIGTFPLCLYYFGTFPMYFFIANLLAIPFSTFIIYASVIVLPIVWCGVYLGTFFTLLAGWAKICLQGLLSGFIWVVHAFERLPGALLQDLKIPFISAVFIIAFWVLLFYFFQNKRARTLIWTLGTALLFAVTLLPLNQKESDNQIYVFNRADRCEIGYCGKENFLMDSSSTSACVAFPQLPNTRLMVVKSDLWTGMKSENRFYLDYLVLSGHDSLSMYHLKNVFDARLVILDGTLSSGASRRLKRECKKLSIDCYDVKEKGAFRIKN